MTEHARCAEEVVRRGLFEPCDAVAIGMRYDPEGGEPYPVCKRHARARMVPLSAVQAEAWDQGDLARYEYENEALGTAPQWPRPPKPANPYLEAGR